ncbi:hypothetical protein Tco_1287895 [Tanacetum coccineum]
MTQSTFKSSTDKQAWQIPDWGDMMRSEAPPEFRRSWCVEGRVRSRVISSVLAQRYLRTIRQWYSPCEGPLSLEWHVADKSYQERTPRLCLVVNPK